VQEKNKTKDELENQTLVVQHLKPKLEEASMKIDILERLRRLFVEEYRKRVQFIESSSYEDLSNIVFDSKKIDEIVQQGSCEGEIALLISDWTNLLKEILEAQYESNTYKQLLAQSKVKLAQATAEKVEAMLKLSNAVNL